MYESVLVFHLMGAVATGIAASFAGILLFRNRAGQYRNTSIVLGFLATFEIVSGTLLAVISTKISAPSLCANIVIYLAFVSTVELLLFLRMKKVSVFFPFAKILSPVASSLAFFAVAVAMGF